MTDSLQEPDGVVERRGKSVDSHNAEGNMMSLDPVIQMTRVSKSFGKQVALDDLSLEIPPGVVFALLGENGAGKTTAIRIMLGLARSDAGTSRVLGLDSLADDVAIRRQVGYVAEQPTLYEWMTVDEIGWFTAGFYPPGFLERYRRCVGRFRHILEAS